MLQKNFFFNCVQWGKESWNVFDYIVFPNEHIFKKNGGQFFTVYLDLLAWPYAICSFPMKKWQMPQPEMGTLDLRLKMECEKITVSYLSLNKHIYEMHTFLNEQLELLLVILWFSLRL